MTTEAAAKKDTQKLQRAIVDGLEDVKAQDIQVFDTEHLSPLFERVIVASGTSNRQTKALAASVRDAVREAGFGKPRIEGEVNGEWIIVDCGAAVAHIMQPAIRQYYHLEEIWGEKPVRTRLGAARPAAKATKDGKAAKPGEADASSKPAAPKPATSLRRSSAAKTAIREAEQAAKKAPAAKKSARKSAAPKANVQKLVVNKAPARKAPAKKSAAGAPRQAPATAKKAARKASPSRS
ncbi:MAG: ribosome silencing factor [Gammaproteobacteria bacterium]|nr:ribosome silencing factor [Gammaproteobacteria bacterium]MBU2409154.1 ribosome silencing factor [Gammaproteobacteria bacterium]